MKSLLLLLIAVFMAAAVAHSPFGVSTKLFGGGKRPKNRVATTHSPLNVAIKLSGGGRRGKKRVPTTIVIAAFHDATKADEAANLLKDAADAGVLYFRNLAVIRKYKNAAVVMHETGDQSVAFAATVGMFVGGLSLLLLGPAGVLAGGAAGGLVGGAGQALWNDEIDQEADESLDKDHLLSLGEVLIRGSSALVCVFEEVMVNKRRAKHVKMDLARELVLEQLAANIRTELFKRKNVAYVISINDKGIRAIRMVRNKKAFDIKGMIITKKGTSVGLSKGSFDN